MSAANSAEVGRLSADKGALRAGLICAKSGLDYASSYLRTHGHAVPASHVAAYAADAQRALDETPWPVEDPRVDAETGV